jgi:hypothetical protein
MVGWNSLWSFGIFFSILVCLDQEKSGNPDIGSSLSVEIVSKKIFS